MDRNLPILNLPPNEADKDLNGYCRRISSILMGRWGLSHNVAIREAEIHWKHYKEDSVIRCVVCGKTFKNQIGLAGHMRTHQT